MRIRLILSFILIVFIAIASVALIARRQTVTAVNTFIFRGGLSGNEELVKNLETYYENNGNWQGVETVFKRPGRGMGQGQGQGQSNNPGFNDQRLQLADKNGLILADTKNDSPVGRMTLVERDRAIILKVDGKTVGYLLPETRSQISQIATDALVTRINQAAFSAAILASVVAIALALFFSYQLLRPVGELTKAAEKLAGGDLSQRVPVRGDHELSTLANSFNKMANSLEIAETQRKALTADIAHELRTPLAVQRAHLEALEDGIYDLSIESLRPIEEHNRLLTRLVEDLRMLALADSGKLTLEQTPIEITSLINRVLKRHQAQADDRQIDFHTAFDKSYPLISLDPQRIEQILHNLMINALRYTPDGGEIHVGCTQQMDQCVVTIRDNGPGIPSDEMTHIFERFYRGDKARSRADGGTGLGLSIARKIARAHDGDLTADNHPDGGAIFTLSLPVD